MDSNHNLEVTEALTARQKKRPEKTGTGYLAALPLSYANRSLRPDSNRRPAPLSVEVTRASLLVKDHAARKATRVIFIPRSNPRLTARRREHGAHVVRRQRESLSSPSARPVPARQAPPLFATFTQKGGRPAGTRRDRGPPADRPHRGAGRLSETVSHPEPDRSRRRQPWCARRACGLKRRNPGKETLGWVVRRRCPIGMCAARPLRKADRFPRHQDGTRPAAPASGYRPLLPDGFTVIAPQRGGKPPSRVGLWLVLKAWASRGEGF